MKTKELNEALRLIYSLLRDPRVGPDDGDQLQIAIRELEKVKRSGKPDEHRVYRAIKIVATVLVKVVKR